jgi:hypothetical protein
VYAAHLHTPCKCSTVTKTLHTQKASIMHDSMITTAKELNLQKRTTSERQAQTSRETK